MTCEHTQFLHSAVQVQENFLKDFLMLGGSLRSPSAVCCMLLYIVIYYVALIKFLSFKAPLTIKQ